MNKARYCGSIDSEMSRQLGQFIARWVLNSVSLFVAALLLSGVDYQGKWQVLVVAAFLLALINALIKPFLVILALPALVLTLGIFSIVINGFVVYLAHLLYPAFEINNFMTAILAGMVVGLVNYILTRVFDTLRTEEL